MCTYMYVYICTWVGLWTLHIAPGLHFAHRVQGPKHRNKDARCLGIYTAASPQLKLLRLPKGPCT